MPNKLQALKDTATWEAAVTYGSALPKPIADNLKVAVKGGGYTLCSYLFLGGCKYYRSIAGYVEIPFQTAYGIPIAFTYTFGIFIDKATNEHNADEALKQAIAEIFRLELSGDRRCRTRCTARAPRDPRSSAEWSHAGRRRSPRTRSSGAAWCAQRSSAARAPPRSMATRARRLSSSCAWSIRNSRVRTPANVQSRVAVAGVSAIEHHNQAHERSQHDAVPDDRLEDGGFVALLMCR